MVQALPCSMEVINSCEALKQDSALGITVAIYPLGYERFLGPELEGPVPTLFSDEPSKAQRAFMKSLQFAYNCLQALVETLLERRELTTAEAEAYLANPAPGVVKRPFQKPWNAAEVPSSGSNSVASKNSSKSGKGTQSYINLSHLPR